MDPTLRVPERRGGSEPSGWGRARAQEDGGGGGLDEVLPGEEQGEGRRWPGSLGGKKMVGGGGAASVIPAPSLSIPSLLDLLKENCFAKGHWSALETREDC